MNMSTNVQAKIYHAIQRKKFDLADTLSREIARKIFEEEISKLLPEEIFRLIDEITGGLGYRKNDFNVMRMGYCGSLIAWPEAVPDGGKVLEIGTGLGRTCYACVEWSNPSLFLTIDKSAVMLAIALYRNPVEAYAKSLHKKNVKIVLGDALKVVELLPEKFNHIIHDGGPNPNKNPRLYSREFLCSLTKLLMPGGTMSVFAGRNRKWQNYIYGVLKSLGFEINSVSFPDAPTLVFRARLRA